MHSELVQQSCYINGQWVSASSGETIEVVNPSNQRSLGSVPKLSAKEVAVAIDAANQALQSWRQTSAKARAKILRRWFDLCVEHEDELARILTLRAG